MSKIEVDAIDKQSGSTLTLGGSGTAVTLACGATQTGFGRTGTVDWQTTKKTTAFTAVNGEGYFVDTAASGAVTMTLPSSPSAGNIVAVKDYNGNFGTANLTIGRNGSPINGGSVEDAVISTNGASIVLVYVDASQGWVATQDDESTFAGVAFLTATGGTITTCGNDKIHTFTGPGTFAVSKISSTAADNVVSYMVIAGGGGGGGVSEGGAGGAGAGGYREVKSPVTPYTASPLDGYPSSPNRITVTAASFAIAVGAGGTGGGNQSNPGPNSTNGTNSSFSTITSAGGGAGGQGGNPYGPSSGTNGAAGGSGGGGHGYTDAAAGFTAGAGNTPPVSPSQGNDGANGVASNSDGAAQNGGGGGGAGAAGSRASPTGDGGSPYTGGAGGAGTTSSINGTPTTRAGGGGGGRRCAPPNGTPGVGGTGGGGAGGGFGPTPGTSVCATAGTDNTGGGGGGGGRSENSPSSPAGGDGKNGGSGIVIIRYKFQ